MQKNEKQKKFKAAIFDLDGVLVDTAKYHYLAWKELADELAIPFTPEDNEQLKGVSRMRSLEILLALQNVTIPSEEQIRLAEKKNKIYINMLETLSSKDVLPSVAHFLSALRNAGIKIALGSASKNAPTILKKLSLLHYFDVIIDGNIAGRAKPDPQVFSLGSIKLQIPATECVVFEDAAAGIEAALAAGMYSVGVGSKLSLTKANIVIPNLEGWKPLMSLLFCKETS